MGLVAYINSIFESIQGEGVYTGWPSIFIRFQGCNVQCAFCDTKDSWVAGPEHEMTMQQIIQKVKQLQAIVKNNLYVITGGEPFEQEYILPELIHELTLARPALVQIETSGSVNPDLTGPELEYIHKNAHICLSPKPTHLPTEYFRSHCDSVKLLVGDYGLQTYSVKDVMKAFPDKSPQQIYLQPMDHKNPVRNILAQKMAVQLALQNGWNISAQTHKFLGIA